MAESKQILIATIKEWVLINSKINEIQKQLREFRNQKKQLSATLISVMENNEIDRFDINNGKLVYRKNKVKSAINKEYLMKMLDDYFEKYPEVDTNDVGNFILDNRPIKENATLVIKENK
jgi:hypothetical protein|tara:strand:+ start:50 stop:409 length:360 start_codon:yes stop_codon:yes gene_type:complete